MKRFRHGDVILVEISEEEFNKDLSEKNMNKIDSRNKNHILAQGEVTGHAHVIPDSNVEFFGTAEEFSNRLLKVSAPSPLSHEEHNTIEVPSGFYRVTQKRMYTPDGWRNIQD